MEDAILHNHLEHGLGAAPGQHGAVKTGFGCQRIELPARHALDELLHVDAFAGVLPVHARHHDERQAGEIAGNALGTAAFAGQVQLAPQRAGKFAHQLLWPVGL